MRKYTWSCAGGHHPWKLVDGNKKCPLCGKINLTWLSPETRFWFYVDKAAPNGCWIWTRGASCKWGYGRYNFGTRPNKKHFLAHRYSWLLLRGEIPDGLELDHLCKSKLCVNPDHLEPVTPKVNTERAMAKPFCKYWHDMALPDAWIRYGGKNKKRVCRRCKERWIKTQSGCIKKSKWHPYAGRGGVCDAGRA